MSARVLAAAAAVGLLVLSSCSDDPVGSASSEPASTARPTTDPATTQAATTEPATTAATTTEAATTQPATTASLPPTTLPPTTLPPTTLPPTTLPPTTVPETTPATTALAAPVPGQPDPACIVTIAPGDSLFAIVARLGNPTVTADAVAAENDLSNPNAIVAGDQLDVCPGNGVDDITGAPRAPEPPPPPPTDPAQTPPPVSGLASGVEAQQQKLNELFGPYGMRTLGIDGDAGRMTKQLLCAARLSLGLAVSRDEMAPGSSEEQALMSASGLPIPPGAPTGADRWALVDQRCQVIFVGQGASKIAFVFPVSTGQAEFPTRDQKGSRVFRYDPARATNGWHDSSDYPASEDNPLNGNMYKPLYFDRGQAIHGANTVPTSPASHGCVRMRLGDQNMLVDWLGLGDQGSQMWDGAGRINLTVSIVGRY